jgi:tetratricopeptide (TPR) repeat protein
VTKHLAELYLLERRPAEAEVLLRHVLSASSGNPEAMAMAYSDLAVAAAMQQQRQKAETLLRQSLTLFEGQIADHPLLLGSLVPLAALLCTEHRYAEAVAVAERAREIVRTSPPSIAPADRAGVMDVLSRSYTGAGRLKDAELSAQKAVDIVETAYGPQHPWLANYLKQYAAVLKQEGQKKPARQIEQRADALVTGPARNVGGYTVSVNALRSIR